MHVHATSSVGKQRRLSFLAREEKLCTRSSFPAIQDSLAAKESLPAARILRAIPRPVLAVLGKQAIIQSINLSELKSVSRLSLPVLAFPLLRRRLRPLVILLLSPLVILLLRPLVILLPLVSLPRPLSCVAKTYERIIPRQLHCPEEGSNCQSQQLWPSFKAGNQSNLAGL